MLPRAGVLLAYLDVRYGVRSRDTAYAAISRAPYPKAMFDPEWERACPTCTAAMDETSPAIGG